MIKRNKIKFGRKKTEWFKIVLLCLAVLLAFFLGFLFAKPIMDIFR